MRKRLWIDIGVVSVALLILLTFNITNCAIPALGETEEVLAPEVSTAIPPVVKPSENRIKLPMVQCLRREELKALMVQCWEDAQFTGSTPGSRAILAAAIFEVRVDNIQSGKEPYVRDWSVSINREDME